MKAWRQLLLSCLLGLLPTASIASSGVVNLSWDDCGAAGHSIEVFRCDTNWGSHMLVGSYSMFVPLDSLNGNEIVIDMQTESQLMSPWWQIKNYTDGTQACRHGSTSMRFSFPIDSFTTCRDYWAGRAQGGFGVLRAYGGNNRQRILGVCAISLAQAGPLPADVETYSFRLVITNARTMGTGSCSGCDVEALLVLQSILATQNNGVGHPRDHKAETLGTYACWSPQVVATRNATWGGIKSLYR